MAGLGLLGVRIIFINTITWSREPRPSIIWRCDGYVVFEGVRCVLMLCLDSVRDGASLR